MNPIPLHELSAFLAYGLTFYHFDDEREKESICTIANLSLEEATLINSDYEYYVKIEDLRPLVIPMDQLTDEDWVEVFKAGMPSFESTDSSIFHVSKGSRFITIKYQQWTTNITMTYGLQHCEFTLFGYHGSFNQLSAFTKLFSLHADVWGWGDRAINKLTFNK